MGGNLCQCELAALYSDMSSHNATWATRRFVQTVAQTDAIICVLATVVQSAPFLFVDGLLRKLLSLACIKHKEMKKENNLTFARKKPEPTKRQQ